ncbi:metal-dependent transcriptional regulator [uncultured Mobiluncus sp.]|uniref:metal-dependent transcriptional regulator n=1 Tax=uncultured Mobiluncus sp. TaxID=293425 RepID=UPI0025DBCB0E|nr:metal-dependent transcriptional regulator [uncultured Mobiluncus sp.]
MSELVDTTEMYLKVIYEMMEDGVAPLRARIVERLGHSGPTVSQTISRMERDGLLSLEDDRKITLTEQGLREATEVIRKHRLAERLLTDVIGLPWDEAHDEACRWEHVMSEKVESLLLALLQMPDCDPYGNPIPRRVKNYKNFDPTVEGATLDSFWRRHPDGGAVQIGRIGEPVQACEGILKKLSEAKMLPGSKVTLRFDDGAETAALFLENTGKSGEKDLPVVTIPRDLFKHFFIKL